MCMQISGAGREDLRLPIPRGLVKDEGGRDLGDTGVPLSDILALLVGCGAATLDLLSGHSNFTLNNLLACLIACDILGVSFTLVPAAAGLPSLSQGDSRPESCMYRYPLYDATTLVTPHCLRQPWRSGACHRRMCLHMGRNGAVTG